MRYVLLAAMLSFISGIACAAGPAPAATQPQPTGQQQATRIETDQKTGAIRFIVNGREEARIDATGLHVRQSVEYGGELTVTGEAYYDKPAKPEPKH
jgi:hypothetical protein